MPKTEKTLFFDFVALTSDVLGGFKTRFQVYTVPGQPLYENTRRILLKGVDGLIFVADSQLEKLQHNLKSLAELKSHLQEMGINLAQIPLIMQFNKADLVNVAVLDELKQAINLLHVVHFTTVATKGKGIVETFKECVRQVLLTLKEY